MKGQLFLEFLIAFLVMIVVIQMLVQSQERNLARLSDEINQTAAKMKLEKMASDCDLIYFNWRTAEFNFSYNLSAFRIFNRTISSESSGKNISSKCLSPVSGVSSIEVEGVKRWF